MSTIAGQEKKLEHLDGTLQRIMDRIGARIDADSSSGSGSLHVEQRQSIPPRSSWIDSSGIPRRSLATIQAGKPQPSDFIGFVESADAQNADILGLLGVPGSGKTLAAAWYLWLRRLEAEASGVDSPALSGGKFIRAVSFSLLPPWEKPFHAAATAHILVIDDLGAEAANRRSGVEDVILRRYDDKLQTVFTSCLTVEEFESAYSAKLVSRMLDGGSVCEVTKRWSDE